MNQSNQRIISGLLLVGLAILMSAPAAAQWLPNGFAVCTESGAQSDVSVATDGSGNSIIAWADERSGTAEIRLQRLDAAGIAQWAPGGISLGPGANPTLLADGVGGAFVLWGRDRAVAQRVDAGGAVLWSAGGVELTTEPYVVDTPISAVADGAGGLLMAWDVSGFYEEVWAARLDGLGAIIWVDAFFTGSDTSQRPSVAADGTGGAFVVYDRITTIPGEGSFQHVNVRHLAAADAFILWDNPVSGELYQPTFPDALPDVAGGVMIVWQNNPGSMAAQRLNASGVAQWTAGGVALGSNTTAWERNHTAVRADDGGLVVAWSSGSSNPDIFAQRVSGSGAVQWGAGGVHVCAAPGSQFDPVLLPAADGGALVAWWDLRNGSDYDIFAQAIEGDGARRWELNGIPVCSSPGSQRRPQIVGDGAEGCVIAWHDERADAGDIYAQRVSGGFACPASPILYVDADAPTGGDGSSWPLALRSLAAALDGAQACGGVTEIWVAAGTYRPTEGTDRDATFDLVDGVAVYGGFAGGETDPGQRLWTANPTILSGDIGVSGNDADNSIHVVTASAPVVASLDGFTVMAGLANGSISASWGGGILVTGGTPLLANLVFSGNSAVTGGGCYVSGGTPTLKDVRFVGNTATASGGGFSCGSGVVEVTNAVLVGNTATFHGGGIYMGRSNVKLNNVVCDGNTAGQNGGGIAIVGSTSPRLTNLTCSGNTAGEQGGAIHISGGPFGGTGTPVLANSVLWGNTALLQGDEIVWTWRPTVRYSLIEGCGGSGGGWVATTGFDGGGNLDTDPFFRDVPAGNLTPRSYSPALENGNTADVQAGVTTDPLGNSRIFGAAVDMGAYEHQGPPTGVEDDPSGSTPRLTVLHSAHPNPFNPRVEIAWDLASTGKVELSIHDLRGRLVRRLVSGHRLMGPGTAIWDGFDQSGSPVASGIYMVRLHAGVVDDMCKITLVR